MFRRDKGSPAQTPVVPPRPTKEELDNPIRHSLKTEDPASNAALKQKTGVMGVVQKVNPFKSSSKATSSSSNVGQTSSSESSEQATDSTQNPGMLKGVMQKVNPFKSTSQVPKTPSSDSLEQERSPDSSQSPSMFKGAMQKVNPFKSSAQQPNSDAHGDPANTQESDGDLQDKRNPGVMSSMIQKVNPFKSSQPKPLQDTRSLHSDNSSSSGSLTDNNNVPEKQNPGMFKGMMQKVNPFKSHTQVTDDACETDSPVPSDVTEVERAIHSENSSSSESLDDSAIERHTIWYTDADTMPEVGNQPTEISRKRTKTFIIKRILPKSFFGSGSKVKLVCIGFWPPSNVLESLKQTKINIKNIFCWS
ncbi:PREDICTED: uncharacterized protein LOC106912835 isoform X4 [Poecilia mexicana]|uniref:uncharacterized protein LOC106912835 isoform X4 n=1 Tax=Poecilia mexicana TaxID=48701 RepID=UPI00072EE9A2|nr:PREDICTED: uncharacterized protein LOC106912835 isoform X4 [Poecilia mexicana]